MGRIVQGISSSGPPPAQSYEGAMLGKIKEAQEMEGEAAMKLIESAAPARAPQGTGQLINTIA